MSQDPHVVAVIVTWNRRDLLTETLTATLAQRPAPHRVVVVDNASTDGTADLLGGCSAPLEVHRTTRNIGGAGGFALGIRHALDDGPADLLWLMDDDTVPRDGALRELLAARSTYAGPPPTLVASRVEWTDGRVHPMNTPRRRPGASRAARRRAADCGCVPIRSASFVSVLVDAAVVRERGLPLADYFLWNDDFEFTTRLLRGRVGLACPASVVVHKTRTFGSTDVDPGERFYFEVRNKVWLFLRARGLAPLEKAVYGASTLVRWAGTLSRSADRTTLSRCLLRGIAAGLRAGPRPTADVLADAGAAADRPDG